MMFWPVGNAAPGELSQSTALAISFGVPMRPTGFCAAIVFFTSVSPSPKARSNQRDTVDADALRSRRFYAFGVSTKAERCSKALALQPISRAKLKNFFQQRPQR